MTEWKKLLRPASVIIAIVILLVLSVHLYGNMYFGEVAFRDARVKMYAYLEEQSDPLSWALKYREEIDALLEETQMQIMFSDDIDAKRELLDEYDDLTNQDGMFASTIGGDYLCLNAAIKSMQRVVELEQTWENEIQNMQRAAKRLNDPKLLSESQHLERAYEKLETPEIGNYEPFENWITWNGSYGWIVMLAVAYIVSFVFSSEKKNGMHALLLAVAIHPRRIAYRKVACSLVSAFLIISLLFALSLGITWYMTRDLWALSQPVQAISSMQYSCLSLKIGEMVLVQYGLYIAAAVLIVGLTLLISTLQKEAWIVFAVSASIVLIPNVVGLILNCPQKYLLNGWLGAAEWLRISPWYVIAFVLCTITSGILLAIQACKNFGGVRNVAI